MADLVRLPAGNVTVFDTTAGAPTGGGTVYTIPTLTVAIANTSPVVGDTLTLTTNAAPGATYQWEKDGTPISGATSATLDTTSHGAGDYTCVVTSGLQTVESAAKTVVVVSGMSFTDSFTAADGTQYMVGNANYSQFQSGGTQQVVISANGLTFGTASATGDRRYRYVGQTAAADQYVEFRARELGTTGSIAYIYGYVRHTDINNLYRVETRGSGVQARVTKRVAGTDTELTPRPSAPTAGTVIRLEVEGTTLRLYYDGVLQQTYTGQTDHTSGQPGIGLSQTSSVTTPPIVDDFACGDL